MKSIWTEAGYTDGSEASRTDNSLSAISLVSSKRDSVVTAYGKACSCCPRELPVVEGQEGVTARAEAQCCDELLQAGVDCSVIALWLGHESVETTQTYLHAHLALKEAALAKLKPYERGKRTRFQPNDRLLAFLEAL